MNAKTYFEEYLPGPLRTVFHTKKGLSWRNAWGVLRYSANNAFIAFVHADQMKEQVSKWCLSCLWRSLLPHQFTPHNAWTITVVHREGALVAQRLGHAAHLRQQCLHRPSCMLTR